MNVIHRQFVGWFEFNETGGCMELENTATITTIISDMLFLAQKVERKNIGNTVRVKINFVSARVGNHRCGCQAFIAVNVDGSSCLASIVDMIRVGEEIDRTLAIKQRGSLG
jgi:hypothetical protein